MSQPLAPTINLHPLLPLTESAALSPTPIPTNGPQNAKLTLIQRRLALHISNTDTPAGLVPRASRLRSTDSTSGEINFLDQIKIGFVPDVTGRAT